MGKQISESDQTFVKEVNTLGARIINAPLGTNVCRVCCIEEECNESGDDIPKVCSKYLLSKAYFKCNEKKIPPLIDFLMSMHNMEDVHG